MPLDWEDFFYNEHKFAVNKNGRVCLGSTRTWPKYSVEQLESMSAFY